MHIRRWLYLFILFIISIVTVTLGLQIGPGHAQDDADIIAPKDMETCLACHAEKVNAGHLASSSHGKLKCQDCHKGIDRFPHPETASFKPSCESCHTKLATSLGHSVHGKAGKKGPVCQTCHGGNPHAIVKPKSLAPAQQEASCRTCHSEKARLLKNSVHGGKSGGNGKTPGCLACHNNDPHSISAPPKVGSDRHDAPCQKCHQADTQRMLSSAHGKYVDGTGKKISCVSCHGGNAHAIDASKTLTSPQKNAMCEQCHANESKLLSASAHGNVDMQGGSKPTCLSCHGDQLHAVKKSGHMAPAYKDATCKTCHADIAQRLAGSVHAKSSTPGKAAPSCLSCHTDHSNPHAVIPTKKQDTAQKRMKCAQCHGDLSKTLAQDVHNRPDKQPGDHPTCISCHGGSPHGILKPAHKTPKEKVEMCAKCHADNQLMSRYGRTDAVEAYEATVHGKAILKLHHTKEATCVDCHGQHGIEAPEEPGTATSPQRVTEICGKCHEKRMDFAYSYASHMRLKVEQSIMDPLAHGTNWILAISPFLFIFGLLAAGVTSLTQTREKIRRTRLALDIVDMISMAGAICSISVIATHRVMLLLGGTDAAWPERPIFILLGLSLLTLVIKGLTRLMLRRG